MDAGADHEGVRPVPAHRLALRGRRDEARALNRAAEHGLSFYTHPEIEFYLFKEPTFNGTEPEPVDQAGYFDHVPRGTTHDFRRAAIGVLESMGISVEFSHHEAGPGQNEIDLRYADALTMADNIMTFRYVVKEVAITSTEGASARTVISATS